MSSVSEAPVASADVRQSHRVWFPLAVMLIGSAAVAYSFVGPEVDDGLRFPFVCMTLLGVAAALNLWWLFLSRMTWGIRGWGLLVQLAVVVLWNAFVRVDGWTGDMYPLLSFRWAAVPEAKAIGQNLPQSAKSGVRLVAGLRDSPRFLGPLGDGTILGCLLDADWKARPPRELWRKPVGPGWSAFATAGDFAVTQEQLGNEEVVTCRRLADGEVVWVHRDQGRFNEFMGGDGPRATPTIENGDVYVMAAIGLLHRLDGATGLPRWTRDILKDHHATNLTWAKSCSPLLVEGLVIVTLGETPVSPSLAAYDRDSGKPVWSAGEDKAGYGTPVLADVAGRRQILVCNARSVAGHDPRTGQLLWQTPMKGDMAKCSNVLSLDGDRVFTSAGYGAGGLMLKVSRDGETFSAVEEWSNTRVMRTRFTNAVAEDHFLFGLDDGTLQCVDARTGISKWRKGRFGQGQILRVENLLIVQAEQGDIVLVAADPNEFRELARLPALTSRTWNYPTLAGNRLLLRNAEEAACYELPLR